MEVKIPSIDKFLNESKPWGINKCYWAGKWHENYKFYDQQRTNPEVKGLLNILGLKKSPTLIVETPHVCEIDRIEGSSLMIEGFMKFYNKTYKN